MWILHFRNTAKILLRYAVNRSLKGADLIGGTFKVPSYIAYISARFLSTASIFVFKSARAVASSIEYQMVRYESDEAMPKMQHFQPRLGSN